MKAQKGMTQQLFTLLVLTVGAMLLLVPVGDAAMQDFKNLSTGISIDTRSAQPGYSLLLKFAEKTRGRLLADINVAIYRGNEKIFETLSPEPWFFIDLPDGEYTVRATNRKDVEQSASVSISGKGQKEVILSWKPEDVDLGEEEQQQLNVSLPSGT